MASVTVKDEHMDVMQVMSRIGVEGVSIEITKGHENGYAAFMSFDPKGVKRLRKALKKALKESRR